MAARAYAGHNGNGPAADEATQRLLPSGDGIELTSSDVNPYRGSAVRRRARVLQRLESMDLENHGLIDKQKLVDIVDDVIESESSQTTVRWGVLLAVVLAAVLLAGILGLTWMVVGRLHTHVDRLSMHVDSLSKKGGGHFYSRPAVVNVSAAAGRPFLVLSGVSRSVHQKGPDSADKRARGRSVSASLSGELLMGGGMDSGRAKLFPIPYVYVFTAASVSVEQLSQICAAQEQGELDFTVNFKGGIMERGLLTGDKSGSLGRPLREVKPTKNLRKATIHDASLCDDPDQAEGTLVFAIQGADSVNGPRWSRFGTAIESKITCTSGADRVCSFRGETSLDTIDCFQCVDKNDATKVWSCPAVSRSGSGLGANTEAEVSRMCGSSAGTCFRNVSRSSDQRDYWMPGSTIEQLIEPTDGCVLFNASSLQCLQCEATCPSACNHADAPPADVCKEDPETLGCDTCTEGPTCGQQLCGETCIPAREKVTVRSQAENPQGFNRFRPCCNSTAGVPWSLQSDAGAPQGEKRCYPA